MKLIKKLIEYIKKAGSFFLSLSIVLFLFIIILQSLILLLSVSWVIPNLYDYTTYLYIITPYPIAIFPLSGILIIIFYETIVFSILFSVSYLVYIEGRGTLSQISSGLRKLIPPDSSNTLILTAKLFLAIFFFDIAYIILLSTINVEPTAPAFEDMPKWMLYYNLAEASVYEEFATRVLFIGIPMLIVEMYQNKNNKKRPLWRYITGGGFSIDNIGIALIVFSALMFGSAHLFSWDWYKVLSVSISGIAFGYLFLTRGILATILLHFAFDYFNIALDAMPLGDVFLLFILIIWLIAGGVYFVLYTRGVFIWGKSRV